MTTAECQEFGGRPLMKQGKKLKIQTQKNFKSISTVKPKVVIGVFRHAESKLCAKSAPSQVFGNFLVQTHDLFLPVFRKMTTFWVKQIFLNISPWFGYLLSTIDSGD